MDGLNAQVDGTQKGSGVDSSLLQAYGFIRNMQITPREGKDSMYKFQVRYIDKDDNEQFPDTWYSGFKQAPGMNGDYIVFKYKQNGIYFNVKEVIDVKYTHGESTDEDKKKLKEINDAMKQENQLDLGSATQVNKPTSTKLSQPYLALLLNATIHLCIKKNTLTDEEIKQQYNRFIQLL